jgi:hypothetical protein
MRSKNAYGRENCTRLTWSAAAKSRGKTLGSNAQKMQKNTANINAGGGPKTEIKQGNAVGDRALKILIRTGRSSMNGRGYLGADNGPKTLNA